jgi:hypothetical protein
MTRETRGSGEACGSETLTAVGIGLPEPGKSASAAERVCLEQTLVRVVAVHPSKSGAAVA